MNDGLSFNNTVTYRLYDTEGNLKDEQVTHNKTQDAVLAEVIDALDTSGSNDDIITMAIGTGTGQATSDTALSSLSSYETGAAVSATQGNKAKTGDKVTFSTTFESKGSWAIEEAGLSTAADGASGLMFYDDSISTAMTSGDTLQIDWEVSVS